MVKGNARGFNEKAIDEIEAKNKQKNDNMMSPSHHKGPKRPQRQNSIAVCSFF